MQVAKAASREASCLSWTASSAGACTSPKDTTEPRQVEAGCELRRDDSSALIVDKGGGGDMGIRKMPELDKRKISLNDICGI